MKITKLVLKTETLRALTAEVLDSVRGGAGIDDARTIAGTCQCRSGVERCPDPFETIKFPMPGGNGE